MKDNLISHLDFIQGQIKLIEERNNEATFGETRDILAKLTNCLRLYYLGINQIYVANILSNNIKITRNLESSEIKHLENVGWVLDSNYQSDVYISGLKSSLILNAWSVLPLSIKTKTDNIFLNNFKILTESTLNESKSIDLINFLNLKISINKDEYLKIDSYKVVQLIVELSKNI